MKVAIVHDDFIQHGGAERLVLAMLEIWPQADLYGVIATDQWCEEIKKKFGKELKTSWLQKFPFRDKFFRQYYSLYPLAIESFRFDDYDLVISSSARYAHGVITKPGTVHIAYINSPARFLWEERFVSINTLIRPIINWHRVWDKVASQRPDYIVANSKTPAQRIKKYWGREADQIIYPFVDSERFSRLGSDPRKIVKSAFVGSDPNLVSKPYFLVVSRLVGWKRIDMAVEAGRDLGLNLIVVGSGPDLSRLKKMSGPTIKFLTEIDDRELVSLYTNCQALIMTQAEDFGITSLEAQAVGKPVIAYRGGGVLETVIEGVTGVFFDEQTKESLKTTLSQFDPRLYIGDNCTTQAKNFGKERFKNELQKFTEDVLRNS